MSNVRQTPTGPVCGNCSYWDGHQRVQVRHATASAVKLCSYRAQQERDDLAWQAEEARAECDAEFLNEAILTHGSTTRAFHAIHNEAALILAEADRGGFIHIGGNEATVLRLAGLGKWLDSFNRDIDRRLARA